MDLHEVWAVRALSSSLPLFVPGADERTLGTEKACVSVSLECRDHHFVIHPEGACSGHPFLLFSDTLDLVDHRLRSLSSTRSQLN